MLYTRKKIASLLFPAFCLLILTGCWSRIEVNDRAFVTSMLIDRLDNGSIEVTLGLPLPNRMQSSSVISSGGAAQGNPYMSVTKNGESIAVAIRKIRSDLTREISWGHCRVVVIGRKMAESGINPILEFTAREPNFHTKSYIMVAPGKAKDTAQLTPVLERLPSEVLREFAKRKLTLDTSIKDFLISIAEGGDTLATLLTISEKSMLSEKGKISTWVGTDGAALFKKDKMIGTFDVKEMRVGLWLKGHMKNSMISLNSPTDEKLVSLIILSAKTKITPVVEQGQIRFDIRIEGDDDILSSDSDINLSDPKEINRIEALLSEQLSGRITKAIKKSQDMGVDVFQFGRYLRWHDPKVWVQHEDDWRSTFKSCKFSITCKIYVRRTGVENNPIERLNNKESGE